MRQKFIHLWTRCLPVGVYVKDVHFSLDKFARNLQYELFGRPTPKNMRLLKPESVSGENFQTNIIASTVVL